LTPSASHRDRWLAALEKNGVRRPKALCAVEVPGGLVQVTIGEPGGRMQLEAVPAHVLMFNLSPVQALWQARDGRTFVSDMLRGEITLMPAGVTSEWSWNSTCDRLDVAVLPEVFGDGRSMEVVDRFLFRDGQLASICRHLYKEISLDATADRLYLESLVMELASVLQRRYSRGSCQKSDIASGGLTRAQARRVLEYIESNLECEITLRELSGILDLSPFHFARMFKYTMQAAPHRYVLDRRIERAKVMLRANEASLLEISLSTGFCDQSHFSSTFRRTVGTTPSEFRRVRRPRV
jgi:AraC family transcriptional regulator